MVVPIVAAAAARAAATSAARAAAANAARTSAQATIRVGAQNATRTTATGARSAAAQGEVGAIRNTGGHAQNTAAERNTIQPGGRLVQSRETGGRGTQTTQEAAQKQSQDEQQSRTRDRRMRQKKTDDEEVVEGGEEEPRKKGISFATLVGMLIVAFIFDGLQTLTAFLVFGFITAAISYSIAFVSNILAWSIFIIWFSLCGISIFRGRRAVVAILGFVADTALAGIVPYWIATVLVAYFDEKLEQKGVGVSKVVSMLK